MQTFIICVSASYLIILQTVVVRFLALTFEFSQWDSYVIFYINIYYKYILFNTEVSNNNVYFKISVQIIKIKLC